MAAEVAWIPAARFAALISLIVAVGGCAAGPTEPPESTSPTDAPSPSPSLPISAGNLPPGCEPIELRAPDGSLVDLNGVWVQDAEENAEAMTWWIAAFGDCFWGTGIIDELGEEGSASFADAVQSVRGTIRNDFTIDSDAVLLAPHQAFIPTPRFAGVTLRIDFDDAGLITLREDRSAGVVGPRCVDPSIYCLAPLLLRPED
jgi:hypothetical protein